MSGTCETFIGPLEEDQMQLPLELHWPEDQPTLMERLHQIEMNGDNIQAVMEGIQRALSISVDGTEDGNTKQTKSINARSLSPLGMEAEALTKIKVQVNEIEGNMEVFEGDLKLM